MKALDNDCVSISNPANADHWDSINQSLTYCSYSDKDLTINLGFHGPDYGEFTTEGMNAVKQMQELEGIKLEGTYTVLVESVPSLSSKVVVVTHSSSVPVFLTVRFTRTNSLPGKPNIIEFNNCE